MQKAVTEFTVIENIALNQANHKIILQAPGELLPINAGQFANIEVPGNKEVFLRRPFSFFEVDYSGNTVAILVKIVGRGSQTLTAVRPGEKLSLVYPLGKGFSPPLPEERVLAVGGGSGIAPLLLFTANAGLKPSLLDVVIGARTKDDLFPVNNYSDCAGFYFTTEDGSFGEKGFVTDHSAFKEIKGYQKIYACGPLPMMKAVAKIAKTHSLSCEVSLENLMACGFGVCLCCIEPTLKGNLCVCTEGPVFNINDLLW
jgi:dihydroorotate dehydrogenase electron transfer subunit